MCSTLFNNQLCNGFLHLVDCGKPRNVRTDLLPCSGQTQLIIAALSTVTVGLWCAALCLQSSCAMCSCYQEIAGIPAMCILIYRHGHCAFGQCIIGVDYSGQGFMVSAAQLQVVWLDARFVVRPCKVLWLASIAQVNIVWQLLHSYKPTLVIRTKSV